MMNVLEYVNKASSALTLMLGVEVELKIVYPLMDFTDLIPTTQYEQDEILISKIIGFVCLEFGIKVTEIKSKKRTKDLVDARKFAAFFLVKHVESISQKQIGSLLAVDRSTVSFYVTEADSLINLNKLFRAKSQVISKNIETYLLKGDLEK